MNADNSSYTSGCLPRSNKNHIGISKKLFKVLIFNCMIDSQNETLCNELSDEGEGESLMKCLLVTN
jgi:hypothetical protein